MRKGMRQAIWRAAALVALAFATLSFMPAHALASNQATTIDARVRVFQKYNVSTSGLQSTFEYLVVPQEVDAPLPTGADGQSFSSFTLTRDEELWLTIPVPVGASPQASSYAYHYELRPKTSTLSGGLYYVDALSTNLERGVNVYYLEVFVQESSESPADALVIPMVHVEGWDGPKVTDPGWRVSYEKKDSDSDSDDDDDSESDSDSNDNRNPSTGSSVTSGGTSNTGGGTSSTATRSSSSSPLSRTGDFVDITIVLQFFLAAAGLVALGVLMRHWKVGDGHA